MTIVLSFDETQELNWYFQCWQMDMDRNKENPECWGFLESRNLPLVHRLKEDGVITEHPNEKNRFYIVQKGADYLRKDVKIVTPFDTDELTVVRAEIARLTAALAESEQARKVADGAWSEAMDQIDELKQQLRTAQQDSGIPF